MAQLRNQTIRRPLVLVLDDEFGPREAMRMVLSPEYDVVLASTADEAGALLSQHAFDLIVFELPRRRAAGLDWLEAVRGRFPQTELLMVTGRAEMGDVVRAMRLGVRDLLRKPFDVAEVHAAVRRALARRSSIRTATAGSGIELLNRLVENLERQTDSAAGHALRVAVHAELLADHAGLSRTERELVRLTGMLHDLGKIGLPVDLLRRPAALDTSERLVIAQHVLIGSRLLVPLALDEQVASGVRHHHERWDGTGYPDRLAGEAIPLVARIVQVADAWDAMTSDRPYRSALAPVDALRELVHGAGTQFDPTLAKAFVELIEQGRCGSETDPGLVADAVASAWRRDQTFSASSSSAAALGGNP